MNVLEAMKRLDDMPENYKTMSINEMEERVRAIKKRFGKRLFIPGHHYQKDEVIQFADATGDSLQLAQMAAQNSEAEYIVFCGVHFMAETADILTGDYQKVILPDMRAGCSMADMADIAQVERAWPILQELFAGTILPLTYVNSTAAIKAFVGRHGGATVTSSNAKNMVEWAFKQKERIFFLPDQHLGRNTAYQLGVALDEMAVWDPHTDRLEYKGDIKKVKVILWKGHCSVHENFTVRHIERIRQTKPDMKIIVHPECSWEVVQQADYVGSTKYIIETIQNAPAGSKWAIGTEMNLVSRIIREHPDKEIVSLNPYMCPCFTMNRIDLPHLLWALESLERGIMVNQIAVPPLIAQDASQALARMLALA
ncbi:quinolinate synthase NadA [Parageobacillus thermoglucosidasius]|uniref:Quinolinate synthase n=1 Tax=Parageobacillus thermoglucosidasius TaxID=1426 RepID=A0AAN1D816_PARTM|nr:quinolinate synthase NadA [Parageobacillus thermoglucosidasius]ALF11654.1 quinolinate synthetase [Parageobacillus thermoglucosidasius]ANZ31738.1 quinolinate synthetase [Parageobacillus thermoglucosidasius]APM82473.1 quinolinate synthetase [Parageobacillus thermoglucosidasius]KJX69607.1 quinolinate synthetase [Parageobacillus thermoglucosidasius]RDE26214.1 quinolinate synthase NadA [Parageobacillus thermoglucosidasius]